ncbi:MAG: aminoglycoside phosphotransferase family protein [Bacilli bacterium]|nr:aminoglycoside phosphotransferase family protein [Bacilli bacterium]
MIEKIIDKHISLFGDNPIVNKINIGFTNTIYDVNNLYIVKICTDIDNEEEFKREIDFYNSNEGNEYIPKLYYFSTDKEDIPYFYEIIEKLKGVSLYEVWHTYSESEREDIIRQLCDIMKMFHNNNGNKYDWSKYMKDKFNPSYTKSKELNIFNEEELNILDKAYSNFDKYLESNDFVLVHNDLHFDNIFVNDGKIKVIDFERSMYAPRDFELDIFYRMIRKPWKFASEEAEEYTSLDQYKNIMGYVKKYYPELLNVNNLKERLAIYDIVYYLAHLVRHPEIDELKEDVLNAAKIVM